MFSRSIYLFVILLFINISVRTIYYNQSVKLDSDILLEEFLYFPRLKSNAQSKHNNFKIAYVIPYSNNYTEGAVEYNSKAVIEPLGPINVSIDIHNDRNYEIINQTIATVDLFSIGISRSAESIYNKYVPSGSKIELSSLYGWNAFYEYRYNTDSSRKYDNHLAYGLIPYSALGEYYILLGGLGEYYISSLESGTIYIDSNADGIFDKNFNIFPGRAVSFKVNNSITIVNSTVPLFVVCINLTLFQRSYGFTIIPVHMASNKYVVPSYVPDISSFINPIDNSRLIIVTLRPTRIFIDYPPGTNNDTFIELNTYQRYSLKPIPGTLLIGNTTFLVIFIQDINAENPVDYVRMNFTIAYMLSKPYIYRYKATVTRYRWTLLFLSPENVSARVDRDADGVYDENYTFCGELEIESEQNVLVEFDKPVIGYAIWRGYYSGGSYLPGAGSLLMVIDDSDNDRLTNLEELKYGTNITNPDSDSDGMPDGWEVMYGLNPLDPSDASEDPDGDGLSNIEEYKLSTDPQNVDSDSDSMPDGWEIQHGFDPLNASDADLDADKDGLPNVGEYKHNTDPLNSDSDSDGMPDGWEVMYGLNPLDPSDASEDPDGDGLSNIEEYKYGTNPTSADSDSDGFSDGLEVSLGTNPKSFIDSPITTRIIPLIIVLIIITKIALAIEWRGLIGFVRRWAMESYEL